MCASNRESRAAARVAGVSLRVSPFYLGLGYLAGGKKNPLKQSLP